jgi:DNA-directed RNA polymerase specialized sigma24 family protein
MRWRRRDPQFKALLDAANRRKGKEAVEQLKALPPSAFDTLPERDRAMVRQYYGLAGEDPYTQAEIAARFDLSPWQARQALYRSVARLLGGAGGPGQRLEVRSDHARAVPLGDPSGAPDGERAR